MQRAEFRNPYHDPRRTGSKPTYSVTGPVHEQDGLRFYRTAGNVSVIAVNDKDAVVTECVTVDGALKHLGLPLRA